MSKIGRNPLAIPGGVTVETQDGVFVVKGPKGSLSMKLHRLVGVDVTEGRAIVKRRMETKAAKSIHGTTRAIIANMVEGVSKGFTKKLIIEGVGFKANVQGKEVILSLGYTHPVKLEIPEGVVVSVEKNLIAISGSDKQVVGQFAAEMRSKRVPDAYKGKGLRYEDEKVRLKPGKKAATATGA